MAQEKPLLLDLFCGAGGAGAGYERAGFRVIGCDYDAKRLAHNPHEGYQDDALAALSQLVRGDSWRGYGLTDFAAIHASPPCQDYSSSRHVPRAFGRWTRPPRLILPLREALSQTGLPWIIENVEGAQAEMGHPVMLCGSMFGLRVRRHRWFDSSHLLLAPTICHHQPGEIGVYGHGAYLLGREFVSGATFLSKGRAHNRPQNCRIQEARSAMGIPWMPFGDLAQAIPPAYTDYLGRQLMWAIG